MKRYKEIVFLLKSMLRTEFSDIKVWLGYIIGIFIIIQNSLNYILYSYEESEPVNVLENYLVATNNPQTIIFISLGIFLIYSNSPYMKGNVQYVLMRTGKKKWDSAVNCYIALQAVFYNIVLFVAAIVACSVKGYWGNIWSVPIKRIAEGKTFGYGMQVNFSGTTFLEAVSPYAAVALTMLLAFLYHYMLGLIIYVCGLYFGGFVGVVAGFGIHLLGFLIMSEGFNILIAFSLLGRTIPVLQIGDGTQTNIITSIIIFILIIMAMQTLSTRIIKVVDLDIKKREDELNE